LAPFAVVSDGRSSPIPRENRCPSACSATCIISWNSPTTEQKMPMKKSPGAERITGFDLARSLALLGMIVIHFTLFPAKDRLGDSFLAAVVHGLDGRPATLFVILAGIGITLMSRRAVWGKLPACYEPSQPATVAVSSHSKLEACSTTALETVQQTLV